MTENALERAVAMLRRKFVAIPDENSERHYLTEANFRNETICAATGTVAAVILPASKQDEENLTEQDFCDAYVEGQKKIDKPQTDKLELARYFGKARIWNTEFVFSKEEIKTFIKDCKQAQDEFKAANVYMPGYLLDRNTQVCFDLDDRKVLLPRQNTYGNMANFRVSYLLSVLRFIQCARTKWVSVYYEGYVAPLVFRAGRLHALVMPTRVID
jgi:hypothetical protein